VLIKCSAQVSKLSKITNVNIRKETHQLGTRYYVHHTIVSAVKRVEFVSYRMSYIVLRGRWCNIIVLNVHAPTEERSVDSNDSFCEELE